MLELNGQYIHHILGKFMLELDSNMNSNLEDERVDTARTWKEEAGIDDAVFECYLTVIGEIENVDQLARSIVALNYVPVVTYENSKEWFHWHECITK